ncbi:hypothetical protein [Neobacillus drentensis]
MAISESLNQHKLKEILINTYVSGMETKNIQVEDLIEEIKKQLLADSK